MRTTNPATLEAIHQAIYDLTMEEGLNGVGINKIAKRANVSPATIYIHYRDKEDLLSKVYLEVKQILNANVNKALSAVVDNFDKVAALIRYFANRALQYPKETMFLRTIEMNSKVISDEARQQGRKIDAAIDALFNVLINDGRVIKVNPEVMYAVITTPIDTLIVQDIVGYRKLAKADIEDTVLLTLNAIRA
ncbi:MULTISPECIES: TetR/AcrR family transcriptional regulator [unclassified Sporolactobacillus]|uniref:TetR/AcrR family transcriptional regulator n=1 Tax=unclassified Sporolactobacillus TaxID=2628533 RepID=UPI002367DB5B|nr:TetR/AcrR family transcriptional regulator [Sporolactobacillus sp. CQH2019]MDD9149662.1 TetR/AcrR family transcriptional regulator [Sporolactobacillus sp. CQH2019]